MICGCLLDESEQIESKIVILSISMLKDSRMSEQILKEIYFLMKGKEIQSRVSEEWREIGFQNTDPMTDVRGAGMWGLL